MTDMLKTVRKSVLIIFLMFTIFLKGEKLIVIDKLKSLENYDSLWNIDVRRIVDPVTSLEKRDGLMKLNGEIAPFTGLIVLRNKEKIRGLYFFTEGREDKVYKYFKNGKIESFTEYFQNPGKKTEKLYNEKGTLKSEREYENYYILSRTDYDNAKNVIMKYKKEDGKMIYYHKGTDIVSSEQAVVQKYSEIDGNTFIKDGETKFYDKKGNLEAIFSFQGDSIQGLPQKRFYPNGQLKIYTIAGNDNINYLQASQKYIEYYDNGEKKFYCTETSEKWKCEEYDKNGLLKGNKVAPALKKANGVAGEFFASMFLYLFLDTLFFHIFD